jgi:toxin-antitoxin system PIN domain toxin
LSCHLLDVNLLIALVDPAHVSHEVAHDWFARHRTRPWATCPITENGFVRILSNPVYHSVSASPVEVVNLLRSFTDGHDTHRFWADTVSLADPTIFRPEFIGGHKQITDVYLLGLCKHHDGVLATLDSRLSAEAIVGPTSDLVVHL